jgi:hypothetical protein
VAVPPLVAAKLAVYRAMLEEGVTQMELAARRRQVAGELEAVLLQDSQ